MKRKAIIFTSLLSILLLLSIPCASAVQSSQFSIIQKSKINEKIEKDFNVLKSDDDSECSQLFFIWNMIYFSSILCSIKLLKSKPLTYGIARVILYIVFNNGMYQIMKYEGIQSDGTNNLEAPWFTIEGFSNLSQQEKTQYIMLMIWSVFMYPVKLQFWSSILRLNK